MGSRRNDLKQAFRIYFRNPGFAAVHVVVLAVGIGAAIFTVFSVLMLLPLALPHAISTGATTRIILAWR
jgi:hypothetical protein